MLVLESRALPHRSVAGVSHAEGGYDKARLRQYELNKLKYVCARSWLVLRQSSSLEPRLLFRYYFAVVECDTPATANSLYTQCDGMEYEVRCSPSHPSSLLCSPLPSRRSCATIMRDDHAHAVASFGGRRKPAAHKQHVQPAVHSQRRQVLGSAPRFRQVCASQVQPAACGQPHAAVFSGADVGSTRHGASLAAHRPPNLQCLDPRATPSHCMPQPHSAA